MNIMLVSVTERTRRSAYESPWRQDQGDHLAVSNRIGDSVLDRRYHWPGIGHCRRVCGLCRYQYYPKITWWVILLALAFSSGVGLFFGIYPPARLLSCRLLRRCAESKSKFIQSKTVSTGIVGTVFILGVEKDGIIV